MKNKQQLIVENSTTTIDEPINNTPATQSQPVQVKQDSSINNTLSKILPIVVGLGGISMLFGKGLFGIGSGKSGLFGGFWGKLIGGSALATILPSLWSNNNIGDRLSSAFKKLTDGDIFGALKTFLGIDSGADKIINKTQEEVNKLALNKDTIEAKAKQFTSYAIPFTKLLNWMKKSNYANNDAELIYITPTVALTLGKTVTNSEKTLNNDHDNFIAVLFLNDQKQAQIQMAQVENLTGTLDNSFLKLLKQAMKTNNLNTGLLLLQTLQNPSTQLEEWFNACKQLINGLQTIRTNDKGNEIILKLFNHGMTNLCEGHTLKNINLPSEIEQSVNIVITKCKIIYEDTEQNFSELLNDPQLAGLKEDPTLNKFDEDLNLLDAQITDKYTKLIQMLLLNQDEENKPIYQNADACVIYGQLEKQHYYYCRDRQNGYLTTDATKSVIFPAQDIKKIESESPIEVSTGQHLSVEASIPILWEEYSKNTNKELKVAFDNYKNQHSDITDIKQLFSQFIKQHNENILPYKKQKKDIAGNTIKETLKNFLIAVKLPQIMKIKKPGIKINVYETNLAFIEKLKTGLKEKLNIDIA